MKIFTKKQIVILITAIIIVGAAVWAGIKMLEHQPEVPVIDEVPITDEVIDDQDIEQDFEAAVAGIETLDNLVDKLNTEFVFQQRQDREIRFPEEFFELRQGNQLDFALFSAYALRTNNLGEAAVIRYKYLDEQGQQRINTVVAFRGPDLPPKHIAFGPEGAQAFTYGWSFEELFQMEEQRLGITITEYEIFLLWPLPTAEDLWPDQWRQR